MLRFWSKKSKTGGFSLAELLAVVAILGILAAIAIPSAVKIQRDLKLLELNDTARQIFIAAQNQLTALRGANGKNALPPKSGQVVEDVEDGKSIYYVLKGDPQFDELLPTGAIDTTLFGGDKTAVIEYNPQSSSIYAVFYAETDAFHYKETGMYRDSDSDKAARREIPLGYYGGDAAGIPSIDVIEPPDITIENKEELKLLIDHTSVLDGMENAQKLTYAQDFLTCFVYTITVTQVDTEDVQKNQISFQYDPKNTGGNSSEIVWKNDGQQVELVLDSLTGPHFADLVSKAEKYLIEPGADITISVQIDYTREEDAVEKHSVPYEWTSIEVNSLFAARKEEKVEGEEKMRSIYQVAYGRHLQNLEERVSGIGKKVDGKVIVQYVEQTRDIDWSYYSEKAITSYGSNWVIGSDGKPIPPKTFETGAFLSITNEKIKSFDGQKHQIKNLRLIENNDKQVDNSLGNSVGLFGWMKGTDKTVALKDIYLVNPYVKGSKNSGNVGALAGYLEKADLENCRVYLDDDGIKIENAENNKNELGIAANTSNGASVGGLVGMAKLVTFEQCFASLPRIQGSSDNNSKGNTGGLVGQVLSYSGGTSKSEFKKCYADTSDLSGYNVGGFIGFGAGAIDIRNCYAVGTISGAAGIKAGFSTKLLGNADTCYSAVTLKTDSTVQQRKELVGFAPVPANQSDMDYTDCYYLVNAVGGPVSVPNKTNKEPKPISYSKLKRFASTFGSTELDPGKPNEWRRIWNNNDVETTKSHTMKPYSQLKELQKKVDEKLYSDTVYPFPRLAAFNHYGNWPLPAKIGSLVYYEVYTDDQIGFEGWQADGTVLETELKLQENKLVKRDGYAWIGIDSVTDAPDSVEMNWNGKIIKLIKNSTFSSQVKLPVYPMPTTIVQDKTEFSGKGFYRQAVIDEVQTGLWFNPHFAKTAAYTGSETPPTAPSEMLVRSARQLAALGEHEEYWKLSIAQQLDIDFTQYDTDYMTLIQRPIGKKKTEEFTGIYNGQCHTIISAGIEGTNQDVFVGLFGYATGALKNIVFRGSEDSTISGGENTQVLGALAGYASGSVENCAVSGFRVTGGEYVGGLIGDYGGEKLQRSSAACQLVSGTYAGGLVGNLSGWEINSCYAIGEVRGSNSTAGIVGGLANHVPSNAINECYSACSVEGNLTYGIAPANVSACYYLDGMINNVTMISGAQAIKYDDLRNLSSPQFSEFKKVDLTYPDTRTDPPYPFLAVVQDAQNRHVHYGDWPEKGEEPEKPFGDVVIGVCVRKGVNESRQETSFEIWGVNKDGEWSDKAVTTFTVNKAVYVAYFTCTGPDMSGNGRWYFWNSQLGGDTEAKHLPEVTAANDITLSGYKFYTANNLHVAGQKTYFYDKKPDGKGNPPAGWDFALTNSDPPKYEANN